MEPSRIERALRNGPVDEPVYRAVPLTLDAPSGPRRGSRRLAGSVAAVVGTGAVVVLASVMAFVVLSPGFGPAGDAFPSLCSPEHLDFRVVRVTDVMGTRRIDTELENLSEEDCAVPRAMHVRIHDRPHQRVPADSELTAQSEGREHLAPGMVRLPSGSMAPGVIEWTNLCRPVEAADLSVLAYLSEQPRPIGTRIETAYDPDGRAGAPACLRPESIALVTPLTITEASETEEWGPLAVTTSPGNGDMALTTGAIRISDECVVLETADDGSTLLVWSSDQASWDPEERRILFRARDGGVVELQDGQQVGLGGSGRGLSAEVLSPGEWDGLSWDEWLPTIDWTAAPDPTCRADFVWSVGEVIVDAIASPVDAASPSQRLANPIDISNGTERPITLLIDDAEFMVVSARSGVIIPPAHVPRLPFLLEARLPSGQLIGRYRVSEPGGFLLRIGLTCGVLDVWSAPTEPMGPRPDPAEDITC